MTDTFSYLGTPSAKMRIAADLTREQHLDLTIREEILWESATATRSELVKKENEFIIALEASNPAIGYNLAPKFTLRSRSRILLAFAGSASVILYDPRTAIQPYRSGYRRSSITNAWPAQ